MISDLSIGFGQTFQERYEQFKKNSEKDYYSFRDECNRKYIEFLKEAWIAYYGEEPTPIPEYNPIPPRPYEKDKEEIEDEIIKEEKHIPILSPLPLPQPKPQPIPIAPIPEIPIQEQNYLVFDFLGLNTRIRFPKNLKLNLQDLKPTSIADSWAILSDNEINNTIRDCLETRIRYNLSDWAYLLFLDEVGKAYSDNPNEATLLTAFLYCQSGYQMRLATENEKLKILYGSDHHIYNKIYFKIDGVKFYPYGESSKSLNICTAEFEGETPMSLIIDRSPEVGVELSDYRSISSEKYKNVSLMSRVPINLIKFFDTYPSSQLGDNFLTRWAMYANVPLAEETKNVIYPDLLNITAGDTELEAVNKILNLVQTGFVYEYDDKVWGHDRAFFAEETLFYPYSDCEDRSILFSRLVRDLLGLDVALVYYPGHLATAVAFNEDVYGDAMMIGGRKFIVCDPTYIGAPAGAQMPNLAYDKSEAIILQR